MSLDKMAKSWILDFTLMLQLTFIAIKIVDRRCTLLLIENHVFYISVNRNTETNACIQVFKLLFFLEVGIAITIFTVASRNLIQNFYIIYF